LCDAHRILRTSLQFSGAGETVKTLLVTSAADREGKSTTSYKLAEEFAALGRNVLLMDADLRHPRLHHFLETHNRAGLSNLLTNVLPADNVLGLFRPTKNARLTFLSAGTIPPNPTNILASDRMALTLHYCAKKYDIVVIDAGPVLNVADARILSGKTDATLLVVAANQVARKAAKDACKQLHFAGANVLGVAFSKYAVSEPSYSSKDRFPERDTPTISVDSDVVSARAHNTASAHDTSAGFFR
ncbi:MAG: CpsD/CapB family tyrosine-protein kinase, partial [Pseudomonadota bacterium]